MNYRLLPKARDETAAAARRYDRQVSGLGDEFVDEVAATVRRIAAQPLAFELHPRSPADRGVRFLKVHRFEY